MTRTLSWYLATIVISHYVASFIQISLHYLLGHQTLGGLLYQKRPLLQRFGWFQQRRRLHLLHHTDLGKNYAVIEFGWDKVFGTYQAVER